MNVLGGDKISVSYLINEYRDCCRTIWNRCYRDRFDVSSNWGFVDSFNIIKEELFKSIVLTQSVADDDGFVLGYPSELIMVRLTGSYKTSVKINRNTNTINNEKHEDSGYWDHPVKELDRSAELLFVDLFDWNPYGFLDMNLVLCEILSNPDNQDIKGHRLLVDIGCVDILVDSRYGPSSFD